MQGKVSIMQVIKYERGDKMFREMRRSRQMLTQAEAYEIVDRATYGVLGLVSDGEYPYTVAVNHVRVDDKIYFHSAKEGHKMDAIAKNPKVSFLFVDKDDIVQAEYTTYFRSANVMGKAHLVEDEAEKTQAFHALCQKTCPEYIHRFEEVMSGSGKNAVIVKVQIEQITGKESLGLINSRNK